MEQTPMPKLSSEKPERENTKRNTISREKRIERDKKLGLGDLLWSKGQWREREFSQEEIDGALSTSTTAQEAFDKLITEERKEKKQKLYHYRGRDVFECRLGELPEDLRKDITNWDPKDWSEEQENRLTFLGEFTHDERVEMENESREQLKKTMDRIFSR